MSKAVHVSIRLSETDAAALAKLADLDGIGVSTLVRTAIRAYLRTRKEDLE